MRPLGWVSQLYYCLPKPLIRKDRILKKRGNETPFWSTCTRATKEMATSREGFRPSARWVSYATPSANERWLILVRSSTVFREFAPVAAVPRQEAVPS